MTLPVNSKRDMTVNQDQGRSNSWTMEGNAPSNIFKENNSMYIYIYIYIYIERERERERERY